MPALANCSDWKTMYKLRLEIHYPYLKSPFRPTKSISPEKKALWKHGRSSQARRRTTVPRLSPSRFGIASHRFPGHISSNPFPWFSDRSQGLVHSPIGGLCNGRLPSLRRWPRLARASLSMASPASQSLRFLGCQAMVQHHLLDIWRSLVASMVFFYSTSYQFGCHSNILFDWINTFLPAHRVSVNCTTVLLWV